MLASLVVMAFAAAPMQQSHVTLLDDRPLQVHLVDDDEDDHLDRDSESSSTRAARLENERPSYFGPIALGVGGLALAGVGVLAASLLSGGWMANLPYVIIPFACGVVMIICAIVWAIHRISERTDYDERIKSLKPPATAAADRRPFERCRPLWSECG